MEKFITGVLVQNKAGATYEDVVYDHRLKLSQLNSRELSIFDSADPISTELHTGEVYTMVLAPFVVSVNLVPAPSIQESVLKVPKMNIPSDAIIARIVSEFGYTEKAARLAVQDLQTSEPIVQEAFEKWWSEGRFDNQLVVEGYTLKTLVEERGFNPMNAFLTMDWLIHEPARAKRAVSRERDYFLVSPEARERYEKHMEDYRKKKQQEDDREKQQKQD